MKRDASAQGGTIGSLVDGRQADFVSSGFGPVLDWDTRDDPFWPTAGHLLHADAIFASGEFLSDFTYRKGRVSFDHFLVVFEEGILAARAAGCFVGGEVPIIDLFLFGSRQIGRASGRGRVCQYM